MADAHPIPTNPRFKDLTGQIFGRLTVQSYAGKIPHGNKGSDHSWNCKCECGKLVVIRGFSLTGKKMSKSCGCLQKDTATKHGLSTGSNKWIYDVYRQMIDRCHNEDNSAFDNYGGRGIIVCERWRLSIHDFVSDMGEPPSRKHMIDRIDNNGIYEPSNCRWANRTEQNRNRRDNRLITFRGETLCMAEWAERIGLTTQALWLRLEYHNWTLERALTTPKAKRFCK